MKHPKQAAIGYTVWILFITILFWLAGFNFNERGGALSVWFISSFIFGLWFAAFIDSEY